MAKEFENADFGEPDLGAPPHSRVFTPQSGTAIPGWTVTQEGVELHALRPGECCPGTTQALRLKGGAADAPGAVCQTLDTVPGTRLTLTWMDSPDFSPDEHTGYAEELRYRVTASPVGGPGRPVSQTYEPVSGRVPNWTPQILEYTATAPRTRVELAAETQGSLGAYIADMSAGSPGGSITLSQPDPNPAAAAPGQEVRINIEITASPRDSQVSTGVIEQTFTAPTGFEFVAGSASFGYYYAQPHHTGNLDAKLGPDRRTLTVSAGITLNTVLSGAQQNVDAITYTLGIRALPTATPGSLVHGTATVGAQQIPITAEVLALNS